ncbi:electron carrier [Arachnomyces sp. PD_36]|nr:electron carrier [Arachnomyces sp. PD_36]
MAPSVVLDTSDDFQLPAATSSVPVASDRVLLLSPPSLSSHPDKLNAVLKSRDRNATDLQMLDRIALGVISLPESTYDTIILLADADGTRVEGGKLLDRQVLSRITQALKPRGRLQSQDGSFGAVEGAERTEAILAGLVVDGKNGLAKPDSGQQGAVPLRFGKKKAATGDAVTNAQNNNGGAATTAVANKAPAGVGFVNSTLDTNDDDDELIDEDELLGDDDMGKPIIQPPECRPKAGKRRRACKDCTCGLSQKLEAEDSAKRAEADKALDAMKLGTNDLAEVDFTVQGKVGSCGSCALGDAFRCDGCPYIGLPAFKPGEEVRLLNNDVQL